MQAFLHQLLSGLASGGIYAGIAIALVVIYGASRRINFAQGEMAMFSTYIAWTLMNIGLDYWPAFLLTLGLSFLLGAVVQLVVIRPMREAPVFSAVAVSTGLLVIFNSVAGWVFGYTIKSFPSPFPTHAWYGSIYMSPHEVGMTAITVALLVSMFLLFRFTKTGLAMRAAAQNPSSSRLVGINVGRMLTLAWGIASAVGAVAGIMAAPIVFLEPDMMNGILLYGFAAAILGGISNPWGAALGGFVVGVVENLAGAYLVGTELKLSVALVIIVGVLVLRPAGLFGRTIVSRV